MAKKVNLLIIPLVFAILIIIGLIVAIVQMDSDLEKMEKNLKAIERKNVRLNITKVDLQVEIKGLKEVIVGTDRESDVPTIKGEYFGGGPGAANIEKYIRETFGDTNRNISYNDFVSLYETLFQDRQRFMDKCKKLDVDIKNAMLEKDKIVKSLAEVQDAKDAIITVKEKEIERFQRNITQQQVEYNQMKAELTAQIGRLKAKMDQMQKEQNIRVAALDSRISELKQRIMDLTKKDPLTIANTEPDGEVIHAENKLGKAWVNLGRVNGIRKGMNFQVFQYLKGGLRKPKGKIEVIKVEDYTSEVAFREITNPKDPIVRGDHIISPFYDKNETPIFVFCGELTNRIWSKRELERKIAEVGGKVEPAVAIQTDYLVAGKGAEDLDDYTKAILLGVIILREKELFDYLGR